MSGLLTYEELEQRVCELETCKTLREESILDRLIENIQIGIVVHGKDGAVIKSNRVSEVIFGLKHDQMLGKELIDPVWTFLREDGSPMAVDEYPVSRILATKAPVYNLVVGIKKSEKVEPVWVLNTAIPEFDEYNNISQIFTTFMDISALKKSEDKYRNLFKNIMHEVHLWKLERDNQGFIKTWILVEANPAALKAWGKNRSDIIGKTTDEIFSFDATEQFMPIVKKIFSEGTPYTWETYFPPTGQYLYMSSVSFGEYFITTGTDITDRKKAEDALRESEVRHRLFNNPLFGGSVIHDKGRILDCSVGLSSITGYSHDELIGMDGLLLITPEWRDIVKDKIASGTDKPYEVEGIRKDGTIYPVRIHAKTIQYLGKSVRVGEFRDISDIKKTEQALEKSERLLRNIIDSSSDYIFVKDKDLRTLVCNETFARAVNKEPFDLIGKTDIENGWDAELVKGNPEKGIRGYEKDDLEVLRGKTIRNTDTAIISGETSYLDSVKLPLKDENNAIFGILGISRDITEKKKAEQALKEVKEQFVNMFEYHNAVMLLIEPVTGSIINANHSAAEYYGYSKTKLCSMNISEINILSVKEIENERNKALYNNQNYFIFSHKLANGEIRTVEVHSSPIKYQNKQILFSVIHDITERKQLEQEKDHLIDELKQALVKVKKLEGLLPICSYCKNIRDDKGYWQEIEKYIHERSDTQFSHSICPDCAKKYFPELNLDDD